MPRRYTRYKVEYLIRGQNVWIRNDDSEGFQRYKDAVIEYLQARNDGFEVRIIEIATVETPLKEDQHAAAIIAGDADQ